jgi:hypothetical protein
MQQINVGLSSWIIQDGNYGDFALGQETSFALEFYPHSLRKSQQTVPTLTQIRGYRYQVCGQVIYQTQEVWVINCGLIAYQEGKPPQYAKKGGWVEGEIQIGIDPFFYFEALYKLPGMPDLTYNFRIANILLETTPWLESTDSTGQKFLARDETQESYTEVSQTQAWQDDNGLAEYILQCEFSSNSLELLGNKLENP